MRIDLDAARAARREAAGEAPVIVWEGQELVLPVELPFEVAEASAGLSAASEDESSASTVTRIVEVLLGDQFEGFMRGRPSIQDLLVLMEGVAKVYGFGGSGESQASAAP